MRVLQAIRGSVIGALSQGQYAPVHPAGRLTGRDPRGICQAAFRAHVVTHLKRCQPLVEGGNKMDVGSRTGLRNSVSRTAAIHKNADKSACDCYGIARPITHAAIFPEAKPVCHVVTLPSLAPSLSKDR